MSEKIIKSTLFPKLAKLYFLKYPTINFNKIKKITKNFEKKINRYTSSNVPSWLEGRAKDISLKTFSFIKNNKHLLSPSKQSFTYQEYQQLLKFKLALENLDILFKEDKKIQFLNLRSKKRNNYRSFLFYSSFFAILVTAMLFSISEVENAFNYIPIFLIIATISYFLIVSLEFRQFFFSSKGAIAEKEELKHRINFSNRKISQIINPYFYL